MSKIHDIVKKLEGAGLPDVDFEKYFKDLQQSDTDKVKRVVDYYDEIDDYIENGDTHVGAKTPFVRLDSKFRFRGGEVTLWSGQNGHKKSMVTGFFSLNFLKQKERVCIASFEMRPIKTIKRLVTQYTKTRNPGAEEFADFMAFAANELYILDQMGGMTPPRLFGVISYCAKELNIKHFVIDSLMRVIPGEKDYDAQKDFIVRLCEIANNFNIHIHLIHHAKKPSDTKVIGDKYDAKGSGALSDNVSNSIIVWDNKEKLPKYPDFILKFDKQRDGEWEGCIALRFDPQTLCFETINHGDFEEQ